MIVGFEIGLALWAISVLIVGYKGRPAKLAAVIALLPLPLSFAVIYAIAMILNASGVHLEQGRWRNVINITEGSVAVLCGIASWIIAKRKTVQRAPPTP